MRARSYLLLSLIAFIIAVTGSDLIARTTIAGEDLGHAFAEHGRWASMTIIGVVLLFVPYGGVALLCAMANRRGRTRSAAAVCGVALAVLSYFYFNGFQAAQRASLDHAWTAAALSVGLLPFFIGIPVLAVTAIAAGIVGRRAG